MLSLRPTLHGGSLPGKQQGQTTPTMPELLRTLVRKWKDAQMIGNSSKCRIVVTAGRLSPISTYQALLRTYTLLRRIGKEDPVSWSFSSCIVIKKGGYGKT